MLIISVTHGVIPCEIEIYLMFFVTLTSVVTLSETQQVIPEACASTRITGSPSYLDGNKNKSNVDNKSGTSFLNPKKKHYLVALIFYTLLLILRHLPRCRQVLIL